MLATCLRTAHEEQTRWRVEKRWNAGPVQSSLRAPKVASPELLLTQLAGPLVDASIDRGWTTDIHSEIRS